MVAWIRLVSLIRELLYILARFTHNLRNVDSILGTVHYILAAGGCPLFIGGGAEILRGPLIFGKSPMGDTFFKPCENILCAFRTKIRLIFYFKNCS